MEMPEQFSEHLDSDYFEFLKMIFSYDEDRLLGLIEKYKKDTATVIIITNSREKRKLLKSIAKL